MLRSSETIGKIAGALAVAQSKLQNPQKNLTAVFASPFPREGSVSFRYASLASGLDIVRKVLGEHEIAAIQSTEIDKELGLIRLNTVLAHSSGEWIGSDWPVCAMTEVGAHHRLGAALTYARRYALFALVGITGEDDLDAPDLQLAPTANSKPTSDIEANSAPQKRSRRLTILSKEQSATLRGQLLSELESLQSIDDLTVWALRRLPLKNRLVDADADLVETAYEGLLLSAQRDVSRVSKEANEPGEGRGTDSVSSADLPRSISEANQNRVTPDPGFEATVVQLPKALRRRDKAHLIFVASQPCLVCQRTPCDSHHLKFAQPRALGRKVSDEFTVPLCRDHHRELHRSGNERSFWANHGIAPLDTAARLWRLTEGVRLDGPSADDPAAVPIEPGN